MQSFEKLFAGDKLSKRERVEATLNHQPVDRAALHDQLSLNPGVIALYTGKHVEGFQYTLHDIGIAIRKTLDMHFPLGAPLGTEKVQTDDGYVMQNDNWTSWMVSRPFNDVAGARDWLLRKIKALRAIKFSTAKARAAYRCRVLSFQAEIGETVLLDYPVFTGLCSLYGDAGMGLELFSYFYQDYPELLHDYLELSIAQGVRQIHAIADPKLSPVILIAEDFATKQGPIFSPDFLNQHHYPYVRQLTEAWHSHGLKVLYHSDGNYRKAIPGLMQCGVDGFYCLEPNCGMDIVEFKKTWPEMVWAGGIDGVDLMERGTPAQVRAEVLRQIRETDALRTGGMFVASSSEINPPIKPENFKAMVDAVGEMQNPAFKPKE